MMFLQLNLKKQFCHLNNDRLYVLIAYSVIVIWVSLEANILFPVSQFFLFDGLIPVPSVTIKFALILVLLCSMVFCDSLHLPAAYMKLLTAFTIYLLFQLGYHCVINQYTPTYVIFSINASYLYFFLFPLFFAVSGVLDSNRVLQIVCTVGALLILLGLCQLMLNKPIVPVAGRAVQDNRQVLHAFFNTELASIRARVILFGESFQALSDVNGLVNLLQENRNKITPGMESIVMVNKTFSPQKRIHFQLNTNLAPEENIRKLIEAARSGQLAELFLIRYQNLVEKTHALEKIAAFAQDVKNGQLASYSSLVNQLQQAGLHDVKKKLDNLKNELAVNEAKSYRMKIAESLGRIIPVKGSLQVLSMDFYGRIRAFSLFDSGSRFGSFLVFIVPVLMTVMLTNQKNTNRLLGGAILSLALLCIYATLTRLIYLQAVAMLITFTLWRLNRNSRMIPFLPVIYTIAGAFCVTVLPYLADLSGSDAHLLSSDSLLMRLEQWSDYLSIWFSDLQTALFGTGLIQNGRFPFTADVLIDNTFIGFGLQNGLIGLALSLALVWSIWRFTLYVTLRNPTPLGIGALCALSTWPIAAVFGMTGSEFVLYLLPMIVAGPMMGPASVHDSTHKERSMPVSL